jgi:hypothetical protein
MSTQSPKILDKYDDNIPCKDGYYFVKKEKKWGLIKDNGTVIVPCIHKLDHILNHKDKGIKIFNVKAELEKTIEEIKEKFKNDEVSE